MINTLDSTQRQPPAAIAEEKNTMVSGRSDKFQREQNPRRNTTYKLRSHGSSVRQMDPSQYLARKCSFWNHSLVPDIGPFAGVVPNTKDQPTHQIPAVCRRIPLRTSTVNYPPSWAGLFQGVQRSKSSKVAGTAMMSQRKRDFDDTLPLDCQFGSSLRVEQSASFG